MFDHFAGTNDNYVSSLVMSETTTETEKEEFLVGFNLNILSNISWMLYLKAMRNPRELGCLSNHGTHGSVG